MIVKPSCLWESKLISFGQLLLCSIVVHHGSEPPPTLRSLSLARWHGAKLEHTSELTWIYQRKC